MSQNSGGIPSHFVVVVPGYMGSKLRDRTTGEIVWLDVPALLRDPLHLKGSLDRLFEKMAYPNPDIEPAGILDQVLFVPPWAKQEHYGRLIQALAELGYRVDPAPGPDGRPAVYSFAYDWRQDNRISARQLGQAIERWRAHHPADAKVWIIAHSNGGIVARWYIEQEGGKERVGRLFLMGSPWDGAPKALHVMMNGLDVLFLRQFNLFNAGSRMKELIRTFPSFYQLLPHQNRFLRDVNNQSIDLFANPNWLDSERDRQLLLEGQKFNQELGTDLSVDTMCFFGRKQPTTTAGVVQIGAGGRWDAVDWTDTSAGDGTVPERSAANPKARAAYAFAVDHGNIYVDPQVLVQLEWELIARYQQAERALAVTERLTINFEPERDVYSPGEEIRLWATVQRNKDRAPVSNGDITVQLLWREPLPGKEQPKPTGNPPQTTLVESDSIRGRYEGNLTAPTTEGYYQLQALVVAGGEAPVVLQELVSIEAESDPALLTSA